MDEIIEIKKRMYLRVSFIISIIFVFLTIIGGAIDWVCHPYCTFWDIYPAAAFLFFILYEIVMLIVRFVIGIRKKDLD